MSQQSYHGRPIAKSGVLLPVSDEMMAMIREDQAAIQRWMTAGPEQRQQWAWEAGQRREAERAQATHVPLTLDALLDKLGWSHEYAEHVVQPHCECRDTNDGWDRCQHAQDLELYPYPND